MPEYLAPGVYVEETSFRAKSIEGVGTSTTAFVGPTRRGPIAPAVGGAENANLELLTSFGDFVRIFGGLEALDFAPAAPNYLAHAVLNFFNEGGSRLYVARVQDNADTAGLALIGDLQVPANAERVFARARFPGAAGNGRITVHELLAPANLTAMQNAPAGALLRAAGNAPVEPARLTATQPGPYAVSNGSRLRLVVNGAPLDLTFQGRSTEAVAPTALAGAVAIAGGDQTLNITLNGVAQAVALDANYASPEELAFDIGQQLNGGYARLEAGALVIGTDRRGHTGRVQVARNDSVGFDDPADVDITGAFNAGTNNVGNLADVTDADINAIIAAMGPATVTATTTGGRLSLATVALGSTETLAVADATNLTPGLVSAHTGLALPLLAPGQPPAAGSNVRLYMKQAAGPAGAWASADATDFPLPPNNSNTVGSIVSLTVVAEDSGGEVDVFDEVSLVRTDPRFLGSVLSMAPRSRDEQLRQLFAFDIGDNVSALELHGALFPAGSSTGLLEEGLTAIHTLAGGSDGAAPIGGAPTQAGTYAAALDHLFALEDVSIVAAPGHSAYADYQNIQGLLRSHVERQRAYRIAVLDTPPNLTPSQARQERARIDSTRLALYYPWITVSNPLFRPGRSDVAREINLPPSGFLCGIYARNDTFQSVSKAPANEVVNGALRFERDINHAENQLLNPLGVNCLRYFPGRGYRVWGARTASSDPEWKYVNVRRFFLYLEASIDRGTQWAVFENNGPRLWANIRETVEAFLYNEWVSGNLLGANPKEAYFVRCDRSTMTQNDLDNGRLICLVGVAALKPAEFVIFRIGQKTADARS
jgi:phage tail sheath protein FI